MFSTADESTAIFSPSTFCENAAVTKLSVLLFQQQQQQCPHQSSRNSHNRQLQVASSPLYPSGYVDFFLSLQLESISDILPVKLDCRGAARRSAVLYSPALSL